MPYNGRRVVVCVCVHMCRFRCACVGSLIVLTVNPTRAIGVQRILFSFRCEAQCWMGGCCTTIDGTIALCAACRYFVTSFEAIDLIILVFLPSPLSYYDCSTGTERCYFNEN